MTVSQAPDVEATVAQIVQELTRLRKGDGLFRSDLPDYIGPWLRAYAHIEPHHNAVEMRTNLRAALGQLIRRIYPDQDSQPHRTAIALYAPDPRVHGLGLSQRKAWLHRSPSAVGRDVQSVTLDLARVLHRILNPQQPEHTWLVQSLDGHMSFPDGTVLLRERRTIVSLVDGLHEVRQQVTTRQPGQEVDAQLIVRALSGCSVPAEWDVQKGKVDVPLLLDRPLRRFEEWTIEVEIQLDDRSAMMPIYALLQYTPCKEFSATVDFGSEDAVSEIWEVNGTSALDWATPNPGETPIALEASARVRRTFSAPSGGKLYGIRWQWADSPSTVG